MKGRQQGMQVTVSHLESHGGHNAGEERAGGRVAVQQHIMRAMTAALLVRKGQAAG